MTDRRPFLTQLVDCTFNTSIPNCAEMREYGGRERSFPSNGSLLTLILQHRHRKFNQGHDRLPCSERYREHYFSYIASAT